MSPGRSDAGTHTSARPAGQPPDSAEGRGTIGSWRGGLPSAARSRCRFRQLIDLPLRVGREVLEQPAIIGEHLVDSFRAEEISVVFAGEAPSLVAQDEEDVQLVERALRF